jgi:hypothetical protein
LIFEEKEALKSYKYSEDYIIIIIGRLHRTSGYNFSPLLGIEKQKRILMLKSDILTPAV